MAPISLFTTPEISNKPALKFADTSLQYWYQGDPKDHSYKSNVWIRCRSKFGREDYYVPLFQIYSYIGAGNQRIWGLSSPKFDKSKFYKDYETAFKWAHKLYESLELSEKFEVRRSEKIKWHTNSGTRKCPVWEEHSKTAFYYANPAITY